MRGLSFDVLPFHYPQSLLPDRNMGRIVADLPVVIQPVPGQLPNTAADILDRQGIVPVIDIQYLHGVAPPEIASEAFCSFAEGRKR